MVPHVAAVRSNQSLSDTSDEASVGEMISKISVRGSYKHRICL